MKRKIPALITLALIFTVFYGCANNAATTATPTAKVSTAPSTAPTAAVSATPKVSTSPFVSQAVVTKAGTLHNTKANIDVALGMKKDEIDKLLGAPGVMGNFNYYSNYAISISYTNDIAVLLSTSSPAWETMDKVKSGSSLSDIKKAYGESAEVDTYGYYFDKDSKQITSMNDSVATVLLKIENEKVVTLQLSGKP